MKNAQYNRKNRQHRSAHAFVVSRERRKGFTIIEVMVVIFILLTIAGVSVVGVQRSMKQANQAKAKLFVQAMKTPLDNYYLNHGKFPETSQGLDALINAPEDVDPAKGDWPYIELTAIQHDPWNQPYNYQCPGTRNPDKYDLWSSGPDRVSGTDDDIGNWN